MSEAVYEPAYDPANPFEPDDERSVLFDYAMRRGNSRKAALLFVERVMEDGNMELYLREAGGGR